MQQVLIIHSALGLDTSFKGKDRDSNVASLLWDHVKSLDEWQLMHKKTVTTTSPQTDEGNHCSASTSHSALLPSDCVDKVSMYLLLAITALTKRE